jgi:hypothetical protein
MKMLLVILGVLFLLMLFFPYVEPGLGDDIRFQLYDDGLPSHCDAAAGDLNYSGCLRIPSDGAKGAWVVDAFYKSSANETVARNGTAIYVEGGAPWHVWVQNVTHGSIWDGLLGKREISLRVSTDREDYRLGGTATVVASVSPAPQRGESIEASADSGTFFYVDLPFTIPLLNIRRIIGSYGVFIFSVFVLSMLFSTGKSVYSKIRK